MFFLCCRSRSLAFKSILFREWWFRPRFPSPPPAPTGSAPGATEIIDYSPRLSAFGAGHYKLMKHGPRWREGGETFRETLYRGVREAAKKTFS